MKSGRLDPLRPILLQLSSVDGSGEDKLMEKGTPKSRIPQMMSPAVLRNRITKKTTEGHSYESATTRLPPTHPTRLLHGMIQTRPIKERASLKRPANLPKMSAPPIRPPTPVIKVPFTSAPTGLLGIEDRDTDGSLCSNDRCNEKKRGGPKFSPEDKKRIRLKKRWQENIEKFESIKRLLHDKQQNLLQLYNTLLSSHKELLSMGLTMCLPPSDDLTIMNVAKLAPGQLLQLCAGTEDSTDAQFDLQVIREIPKKIVSTCEQTLNSRKEIIDWFEDVMAKKMITKNVLVKKLQDFKVENEEFQKSLDNYKEDFMRFLNETDECIKKGTNNTSINQLRYQSFAFKLSEMNVLNENLQERLLRTEEKLRAAENKSKELEKKLKDEKHKKKDTKTDKSKEEQSKDENIAQITQALEQATSKNLSLEKMVCQLREEILEIQSNSDKKMTMLKESMDINTQLFDEITADRIKLLADWSLVDTQLETLANSTCLDNESRKQGLEQQLIELRKNFEEALQNMKHESNSNVAKLIETENKYKEALAEKKILAEKIESMCAQLLESELRFTEASVKLTEVDTSLRAYAACQKEVEMLNSQLGNAKEEIMEYKNVVNKQKEALQELQQNLENSVKSAEQLKSDLISKETTILELVRLRTEFEQRLLESKKKSETYAQELSHIKNEIASLQEIFGEFKTFEDLHKMIKQQNLQLKEANVQNNNLNEALKKEYIGLKQHVKTITEQGQLLEDKEAALKMLTDKNEEQTNIIKLLRNNLDSRTQADIEINRQIEEKNGEIESLISNVEKRKQQISQLEKIILTLENQIVKLSEQKMSAHETIQSLEKKLCVYESYYTTNAKRTESSTDNLDDLINILEYELTNRSEDQINHAIKQSGSRNIRGRRNKRGPHINYKNPFEKNLDMYRKVGINNNLKSTNFLRKYDHKSNVVVGNKMFNTSGVPPEYVASTRAVANPTAPNDLKNLIQPITHQTTSVNYCLIPNYIKDEKKLKMFKLAGHKLQ